MERTGRVKRSCYSVFGFSTESIRFVGLTISLEIVTMSPPGLTASSSVENKDGVMSLGQILDADEKDLINGIGIGAGGAGVEDGVTKDDEDGEDADVEVKDGYCVECEGMYRCC